MLRGRWKKNVLWTGFVVALLATLFVIMAPVRTQPPFEPTVISVDTTLFPFVNIYVDDVEAMWGFEIWVQYNSSVLNATNQFSWSPFDVLQGDPPGGEINNTAGYVALRYSHPMGEPNGLTTTDPVLIATINFTAVGSGWSLLRVYGPLPYNVSTIIDIYGDPISHDVIDGFFANVPDYPHDIAVTGVDVSPTRDVAPGELVSVNVSVANQAPFNETFTVTAYADTTVVDSETVSLDQLRRNVTQLEWDTTGFAFGHYNIRAEASVVTNETDTDDNTLTFGDIVILGVHDIAVTDIMASPKNLTRGDLMSINVTVMNLGDFIESFNVTAKYGYVDPWPEVSGEHMIDTQAATSVANGTSRILTFIWNTSDVKFNPPSTSVSLWIKSNASVVPYETVAHQANNKHDMDGDVTVWLTGSVASFTYLPLNPLEGGTVTFDASASYSVDGNITSYKWDFGDGNVTTVTVSIVKHTYAENGTYSVTLTVTDDRGLSDVSGKTLTVYRRDIAIVSVVPSLTEVNVGDSVSINVTVTNQGDYGAETFDVITYYDDTTIDTLTVNNLALGASETLTFTWDTTGVTSGTYTVKAEASAVTGEADTADNILTVEVKVGKEAEAGQDYTLYIVAAVVIVVVVAALVYVVKIRKP